MRVGVGYSDNPDSTAAGVQAAVGAVAQAGREDPCDMVLLFATARHDARALRDAVLSVVGHVPVVGGGAVGTITNDRFGYAGDQIAAACVWLEGVRCELLVEDGLLESEEETGKRLGKRLAERGTTRESPVMLFYDAIDRTGGGVRMIMATWLLAGLEQGLGFLPDLTGAGMQGDYICTPTPQWTGEDISEHRAMALAFSGDIRIDNVIMHGCRPATRYYTVTKADRQVILEINGQPALQFIDELLNGAIPPEGYPFFLILGVNRGGKWGEYDENNYASRLCLAIDKERGGIVMFEPDMVEGTEFQIMYRSFDLGYMKPKIESLFQGLGDREPVFAFYIDCAGRAAGYGGVDMEDAVVLQNTVAGRVPLLGIYTGVEIASIGVPPHGGRPRGLDWTGVFCLFSVPKGRECQ
ncbi:MAG: FIST C-terminal domain-containing protein [Synergistaceae bacterium]|nr:FIST C-terminal domain-containing protein [Synergistaceae bacterium]